MTRVGRRRIRLRACRAWWLSSGKLSPNPKAPPYCPDASLRHGRDESYGTFDAFMDYAAQLDPIFLFIHQFNEFVPSDEGFDANTDDDIEPANLWGYGAVNAVRHQIKLYRLRVAPRDDPSSD